MLKRGNMEVTTRGISPLVRKKFGILTTRKLTILQRCKSSVEPSKTIGTEFSCGFLFIYKKFVSFVNFGGENELLITKYHPIVYTKDHVF